ncbi:hypothetical protein [Rhodococcus pyridinivorans]
MRVCGGGVGAGGLGAVAFGCRRGAGGGEFGFEPPGVFGCSGRRGVFLGDRSGQPLAVLVELPGEQLDPVLEADDLLAVGRCGLIELLLPAVLGRGVVGPGCGELGESLGGLAAQQRYRLGEGADRRGRIGRQRILLLLGGPCLSGAAARPGPGRRTRTGNGWMGAQREWHAGEQEALSAQHVVLPRTGSGCVATTSGMSPRPAH